MSPLSDRELVTSPDVVPSFDGYRLCPEIKAEFHEQSNPLPSLLLQICPLLDFLPLPAAGVGGLESALVPEQPEGLSV